MKRKSVLITGAAKGLGRSLALIFAIYGYNLILNDKDKKGLIVARRKILRKQVNCDIASGDINSNKVIQRLFKLAQKRNLSVLVNNAAVHCPYLPLNLLSTKQIEEILCTNLISPIRLTKKIYALFLRKKSGTVININSISGLESQKLRTIYCASKWGLRGFTDSFRIEAKKHKIRVLNIYPSRIKTKPKFIYGMVVEDVAKNIFDTYKQSDINEVVLDERSQRFKKRKK